ncbi:MAG: hypothetical protein JWO78_56 [Micavibrio sp.]|nr:hypothetical protein [Micavibrio sp.]
MLIQTRNQALHDIATLARKHQLGLDDIAAALTAAEISPVTPARNVSQIIISILSYIGGLMVFSGLYIYTEMQWSGFAPLERVLITLGPGIVAQVLAVACLRDERYHKASAPLQLIASVLQPTGLLVFLKEYFPPSPHPELAISLVFLILGLQQAVLFRGYGQTLMVLSAVVFSFTGLGALLYWLHADLAFSGLVLSFAGLCLTQGLSRSRHHMLAPWLFFFFGCSFLQGLFPLLSPAHSQWLYVMTAGVLAGAVILYCILSFKRPHAVALFFAIVSYFMFLLEALGLLHMPDGLAMMVIGLAGCAVAYDLARGIQKGLTPVLYLVFAGMMSTGMFELVRKTPYDPMMIGFGALMMYISVVLGSRMVLAVSVLSLLGFFAYYTDRYFAHVVGWPLALIGFGMVLILTSVYAVKLGRKITKTT